MFLTALLIATNICFLSIAIHVMCENVKLKRVIKKLRISNRRLLRTRRSKVSVNENGQLVLVK
jgi:hypothetical protein